MAQVPVRYKLYHQHQTICLFRAISIIIFTEKTMKIWSEKMAGLFTKVEKKKRVDYKFKIEESTMMQIEQIQSKLDKVNEILVSNGESKLTFDLDEKMSATLKRTVSKGEKELDELLEELKANYGENKPDQNKDLENRNEQPSHSTNLSQE
ncbi:hypothetical protein ACOJUY_004239 [Vibrio alginolyticus]